MKKELRLLIMTVVTIVFMFAVMIDDGKICSLRKSYLKEVPLNYVGMITTINTLNDSLEAKTDTSSTHTFKELEVSGLKCNISEPTYKYSTTTYTENIGSPGSGILTASGGVNYNANGNKETYYNLNMNTVVSNAYANGITGEYWIRDDGVKMLGSYVMVAACYSVYPYGSLVDTSLGTGIVVDTGGFAESNPYQLDIAVSW